MMDRVEILCGRVYRKTVGSLGQDKGQVYLPKDLLETQVIVFWDPKSIRENVIGDGRVVVTATVEGWEKRVIYPRGTTAGFNVGKDRVGGDVLIVPCPARVLIVA